ncbi:MAG TPA: glycosyltransferase [Candidatus Binataceae bacterium]|nr:glycosyltransferase [Candidatus Binataceae bacterium]
MDNPTGSSSEVSAHGKFFSRSGRKFFFKGMRLPDLAGELPFAEKIKLRRRFDDLKLAHSTGLLLSESQVPAILDIAAQAGLPAIVELTIAPTHLFDRSRWADVVARVAHTANVHRSNPELLGYLLDCPIGQDELRLAGLSKVQRRLAELIRIIKERDSSALVAIKHRPPTCALSLLEEDFLYAEVPPLGPVELRDFVVGLHNLAEARPVVIDFAEASPGQDEAVAVAFGTGAAGVVASPVPALPSHDWLGVKMLRGAELMPFVTLNGSCPPGAKSEPMVSVVICAYNAERTMRPCLESLTRLTYPNYEVVIIDDGSRDKTAEIAMDFPQFRLIRQPNKGLSVARNVGMHAARGEIVAYTDSDCVADPHWLTLMVRAMTESGFDGIGGPNYAPHEDGRIEGCVAASPGAPAPVLLGASAVEHLAGCNMVFTKESLLRVGGFDPQFTSAGDDVDMCWRLLDAGYRLGYCPAAFVWHFRRNSIKAYYGQQRGYGRAEAMLYSRYPERFNLLGQIKWHGTIPGLARTIPGGGRRRILWSATAAGAQGVSDPTLGLARFLPQTLEWTALWSVLLVASIAIGVSVLPALAMLALGPIWAVYYAWHAPLEKCHETFFSRLLIAFLAYTGPMRRTITRYRTRLDLAGFGQKDFRLRQRPAVQWLNRSLKLEYWNQQYINRDALLDRMMKLFARTRHPAIIEPGWRDYDLEVRPDALTRIEIKTADEEHEGTRLKNHVLARVRLRRHTTVALAVGVVASTATAALAAPGLSLILAALTLGGALSAVIKMVYAGRLAYRATEECASELALTPLGRPVRSREPMAIPEPAATSSEPARALEITATSEIIAD